MNIVKPEIKDHYHSVCETAVLQSKTNFQQTALLEATKA